MLGLKLIHVSKRDSRWLGHKHMSKMAPGGLDPLRVIIHIQDVSIRPSLLRDFGHWNGHVIFTTFSWPDAAVLTISGTASDKIALPFHLGKYTCIKTFMMYRIKAVHAFAVFCFVVVILWVPGGLNTSVYPYSSGLLHTQGLVACLALSPRVALLACNAGGSASLSVHPYSPALLDLHNTDGSTSYVYPYSSRLLHWHVTQVEVPVVCLSIFPRVAWLAPRRWQYLVCLSIGLDLYSSGLLHWHVTQVAVLRRLFIHIFQVCLTGTTAMAVSRCLFLHIPQGCFHDDVIKLKHFPRHWPFVRGIHRSPVNSPHKGQWRGALIFSLICVWTNGWANHRDAGDLRRHRAHYDVTVMYWHNAGGSASLPVK